MDERSRKGPGNRGELGFVETVQSAFGFLVDDLGFRLVKTEPPTFVRYESDAIFLNVYHGRQSYELNVEIGRLADAEGRSYHLPYLLGALAGEGEKRGAFFQASDAQAVQRCVRKIADLVATHCRPALSNDTPAFERIEEYAAADARATTKGYVQRPVRKEAEEAWRSKNYAKVEELYRSIRDDLTPVERERLKYAEKHRSG